MVLLYFNKIYFIVLYPTTFLFTRAVKYKYRHLFHHCWSVSEKWVTVTPSLDLGLWNWCFLPEAGVQCDPSSSFYSSQLCSWRIEKAGPKLYKHSSEQIWSQAWIQPGEYVKHIFHKSKMQSYDYWIVALKNIHLLDWIPFHLCVTTSQHQVISGHLMYLKTWQYYR